MKKQRLLSLDVFRGITIAFMIIVNTPGSWQYVYSPLRHSKWDGCTPTDLVFPAFLFIVGVSMWFSMKRFGNRLNRGSVIKIVYRTIFIFLIGILLHLFPFYGKKLAEIRIMGVLQRIALAYGFGAFICLGVKRNYLWIIAAAILTGYWLLMRFGGGPHPFTLEENLVLKVDLFLFGPGHLYSGFGIPFDPEGVLSTIPAIVTVIIGYLAGAMIGKGSASGINSLKMVIYGIAAITAGLIWGVFFPVNKPLWSSSYVLLTGGISLLIFGFLYLVIDVMEIRWWSGFFRVFGINALFIYLLAGLWTKAMIIIRIGSGSEAVSLYNWIYSNICVPLLGNLKGSLLFAIIQVLIMWIFGYILYRNKIYLKI